MKTTDNSRADALTDRIKAMFVQNPSDELGPSDEPESQYRFGYNTALEDVLAAVEQHEAAQADAQVCQHCDCTYPLHDLDCPVAVEASKRAAQPEQPATTCSLCHDSGYMDETLGGALPGVPDAPCVNGCKPEPPAAAERAAFETLKGAWQSMPPFDVFCAGWRAARASSPNAAGAEGVRAWETDDGRVISDEQKQKALRDGGASASSVRPYAHALGRIAPAQAPEPPALESMQTTAEKTAAEMMVAARNARMFQDVRSIVATCADRNARAPYRHVEAQRVLPLLDAFLGEGYTGRVMAFKRATTTPASAPVGLTDQQVHDAIKHAEQEICRIAPFSSIEDRRFAFCRALLEGAKQ
ncbi:TPA: hypothetical protein ACKE3D_002363 [Burkholderia dolosa]